MTISFRVQSAVGLLLITAAFFMLLPTATKAAELASIVEDAKTADYQSLKSMVAYLTAYLDATLSRKPVPTTFVTALSGNVVRVDGTIVRAQNRNMMEICGPMVKGAIDWGDGVKESLHGLGCSGDVHRFVAYHAYGAKGSHTIAVSGGAGKDGSRVVAAGTAQTDTNDLLTLEVDGLRVEASGTVLLDATLPKRCEATHIATVFWGDGSSEQVTTDCSHASYELAHEYVTEGVYKVLIIDTDSDAAQELVTLKAK